MSENTNGAPAAPAEQTQNLQNEESSEEGSEIQAEGTPASTEEVKDQLEQAVENGQITKKDAVNLLKKYELKVRGKTITREVDLGDDEYIKQQLQLAEVSKMSMQETAELKKLFQSEVSKWKQNPWSFLEELGFNPDELAEARLQSSLEQMKKSPEEVERERITKELEEARAESKKLKEDKERIEFEKLQETMAIQIEDEITKVLDAHKSLPKTPYVVKRIADSMLWAMNNGFPDATAEDVMPLVEKEIKDEMSNFVDNLPEELLETVIGKRNIDRLRKKRLSGAKVPSITSEIKPTNASVKKEHEDRKVISPIKAKDFFRKIGK